MVSSLTPRKIFPWTVVSMQTSLAIAMPKKSTICPPCDHPPDLSSLSVLCQSSGKSVMQSEIALSTVEAEHIALSTAMRKLIQLQTVLFKIKDTFGLKISNNLSTMSAVFEDNRALCVLATTDPPRMTLRLKSLAMKCHWFCSHLSEG